MPRDWRQKLRTHQKVRELTRRLSLRKRELDKDKQFLIETERLRSRLKNALADHPRVLLPFFQKFCYPVGPRLAKARQFVGSIKNKGMKKLLGEYLKYVPRFGVLFLLRGKPPRFRQELLIPWGNKFHVKLVGGHFEPAEGYPGGDVPYDYYYEADRMEVPPGLEKLVASGIAKFVLIEDESWSSSLSKLEYFANYPEGLTFVVHEAEQPYLLCLIGEKVSDKVWKQGSRARSALLRKYFDRGKAGRRPSIPRLRRAIKLRTRPGSLKSKIIVPDEPVENVQTRFRNEQSYVSRVGAALRK